MKSNIGIIGCGWLGLPLAKTLLEQGHRVKGTTTSTKKLQHLEDSGISAYAITLLEEGIKGDIEAFLSKTEILIINVPPGLRGNPQSDYVKKMQLLKKNIQHSTVKKVLFISSTSIYGDQEGDITEDTLPKPTTESGKQLLAAEQLLSENNGPTTIVRFGGLIGPDRHPVYHLAKKENLKNGNELVNLIHLDDCLHMMATIIKNGYWGEVFNGVYPYHPTKKNYYTNEAKKRNIRIPQYTTSVLKNRKKRIISKNFLYKGHTLLTSIVS